MAPPPPPPLATRLHKTWKALVDARNQRDRAVYPITFIPYRLRVPAMKKAKQNLSEAQHRMDTLLDELRQQPQITLHTSDESTAFGYIVNYELGDRGKLRAVQIRPSMELMEMRSDLIDWEFEEYYFLPDDAARRPPVSAPFIVPDLCSQLQRAVQLGDAEAENAKPRLPPAQAIMDRMIEELRTSECLDLYDLEQVHAFLEIRKQLGDCGRLRRVRNKCPESDEAEALQMWQVLYENGFEQYFELPPPGSSGLDDDDT